MIWRRRSEEEAREPTTSWEGRWKQTGAPGDHLAAAAAAAQCCCPGRRSSDVWRLASRSPAPAPPPPSWGPSSHSSSPGSGCFFAKAAASLPATLARGACWMGGMLAGGGWPSGRAPGSPGKGPAAVALLLLLLLLLLPAPAASLLPSRLLPTAALPSTISLSHLCTRHL